MSNSHVDADLSIVPQGQARGLVEDSPAEQLFANALPTFGAERPGEMVPPSKMKDLARARYRKLKNDINRIFGQGEIGSCTGFGMARLIQITRRRRFGIHNDIDLSGLSTYLMIPGVTQDSGASLQAAMKAGTTLGSLPDWNIVSNRSRFKHTFPLQTWKALPRGYSETSLLFKGEGYCIAQGRDEIFSGLIQGYCGIVGRDQHCVPYTMLNWEKNDPTAEFPNSWTEDWGNQGFGEDTERILANMQVYFLLGVVPYTIDIHLPSVE